MMQKRAAIFSTLFALLFATFAFGKITAAVIRKGAHKSARQSSKDTLAYTYNGEDSRTDSCKNAGGCSYTAVYYPVFNKDSLLNDTIKQIILNNLNPYMGGESRDSKDFEKTIKDVVGVYSSVDSTSEQQQPMTYELNISVLTQGSSLIVIDVKQEMSGGAHPNSSEEYFNWDTKTDRVISIDDLLVNDYDPKFTAIAEKIFRKDEKLGKNEPLNDYNFENGEFALNDNFRITPLGIDFFYNTYEIKSYAGGTTDLLIPYSQIKSLLRPNTVVSQYIK
jgi:hypothetical protein